jgi:hypothetical protein
MVNSTGIHIGMYYKVPFGHELPFPGRFLKAHGHNAAAVFFKAASGRVVSLTNIAASELAKNATRVKAAA